MIEKEGIINLEFTEDTDILSGNFDCSYSYSEEDWSFGISECLEVSALYKATPTRDTPINIWPFFSYPIQENLKKIILNKIKDLDNKKTFNQQGA